MQECIDSFPIKMIYEVDVIKQSSESLAFYLLNNVMLLTWGEKDVEMINLYIFD